MRRAILYFAITFISSGQPPPQNTVASWFPAHPGDKWIYAHERRDDVGKAIYTNNGRFIGGTLRTTHWETEETVTGAWTIPEGTLIGKQVRVTQGAPPQHEFQPNTQDSAWLIRGNCLYSTEVEWDPATHQLTPQFRHELQAGHLSADFCFPLATGKTWGAAHFMNWRAPADAKDWKVAGISGTTFHVISTGPYLGSGETAEIWFKKGVGIVREVEIHHGTVGEGRIRLVRFEPASTRP